MPNYRSPRRALTRRRLRGQLGVNRVWDRHMPSWGRRPAPSSPSPPCAWPTCVSAYEPGEAGPALEVNWRCRPAARCRARRRRPEHQEQLGGQHQVHQGQGWPPPRQRCSPSGQGQSRDERGRCATSRSSETGSGHESSGSAWIDWKVRVCAMRNLGN